MTAFLPFSYNAVMTMPNELASARSEGKRPALDSAFPSLTLMAIGLITAVGLIIICGWKIILLEEERQDIKHERLQLERDRDAFLTYGSELPQLKNDHRVTTEALAMLDEQRKLLEKNINELTEKREALHTETRSLSGSAASLQAQIQSQNAELAANKAGIAKIKPELTALRKDMDVLKAQEKSLRESILAKRKEEAALLATVAGLERSRAQAEEFLSRVRADKEMYASVQKDFSHILATFEGIVGKSGTLSEEYAAKLEDMAKFKTHLDRGMAEMDADLQALASHLETMKQDRAVHAALLKQGQEHAKNLQTQVESVTAGNKKFTAAMESVQGLDKKLQAALAAEVKTIAKLAGEDSQTRADLAAAAKSLGQSAEGLKKNQQEARENNSQVAALLNQQREELRQLQDMASDMASNSARNHETALSGLKAVSAINETAQGLNAQAEKLQSRLELAQTQGDQMQKLLDAERERLSGLLQAARDMRQQLTAATQREEEMKAALAEILSLLRHNAGISQSQEAKDKEAQ